MALEVRCQNGDLAKTGDVVAFKRAIGYGRASTNDLGELDIRHETGIRVAKPVLCSAKPVCIAYVHCVGVCFTQGHGGSSSLTTLAARPAGKGGRWGAAFL